MTFPKWRVTVTVNGDVVKTFEETATTGKAAIAKVTHKMRGAVSNAGAFKFHAAKLGTESHARKKSSAQLDKEIAQALAKKPSDQWTVHDRLAVMTPAQKMRERKDLEAALQRTFSALGYAGNTPEQVSNYRRHIDELQTKIALFK
jgi:hypothetical protein